MKIVSPILIYFAGIVGGLKGWLITLSILALSISCVSFIYYMFKIDDSSYFTDVVLRDKEGKEIRKAWSNSSKRILIIGIVLILINTFIPNKETIYTMTVFDTLTVENIQSAGKTGKEVIDYVVDQIDRVINDDESSKTDD